MAEKTSAGRKLYKNDEGESYSEVTKTVETKYGWVNVPSVDAKGNLIPEDKLADMVNALGPVDPLTGSELKTFKSVEDAVTAAMERTKRLSKETNTQTKKAFAEGGSVPKEAYDSNETEELLQLGFRSYVNGDITREQYLQGLQTAQKKNPKDFPGILERNTDAMIENLNALQFDYEDTTFLDPVARDAAVYKGGVPFGSEGHEYIGGHTGLKGVYLPRDDKIYYGDKDSEGQPNYRTAMHEGSHTIDFGDTGFSEEKLVRMIDGIRMHSVGREKLANKILEDLGYGSLDLNNAMGNRSDYVKRDLFKALSEGFENKDSLTEEQREIIKEAVGQKEELGFLESFFYDDPREKSETMAEYAPSGMTGLDVLNLAPAYEKGEGEQEDKYVRRKGFNEGGLVDDPLSVSTTAEEDSKADLSMDEYLGLIYDKIGDFLPGVGEVKSGLEGIEAAQEGDYTGAALGMLGAIPGVGAAGRAAKKGGEAIAEASPAFREFFTPIKKTKEGFVKEGEAVLRASDETEEALNPRLQRSMKAETAGSVMPAPGKFWNPDKPSFKGERMTQGLRDAGVNLDMEYGNYVMMGKGKPKDVTNETFENLYITARTSEKRSTGGKSNKAVARANVYEGPTLSVDDMKANYKANTGNKGTEVRTNLLQPERFTVKVGDDFRKLDNPIVAVETKGAGGKHFYTLDTQFVGPARMDQLTKKYKRKQADGSYKEELPQPNLRPVTVGDVQLGNQVGTIKVGTKEHPIYDYIEVDATASAPAGMGNVDKFYKGGSVEVQTKKAFAEGGLMDEGGTVDPVSGNEVPVGSTQEEVRDDVPAQLSEGEFVLPADVVRYIGLENIMKMRDAAKEGLDKMEAMGQMGNSDEATMDSDADFDAEIDALIDALDNEDEPQEFAVGGLVGTQSNPMGMQPVQTQNVGMQPVGGFLPPGVTAPTAQPSVGQLPTAPTLPMPTPATPTYETKQYIGPNGEIRTFTFVNGQPTIPIPEGFKLYDPSQQPTPGTGVAPVTGQTSVSDSDSDGDQTGGTSAKPRSTKVDPILGIAKGLAQQNPDSRVARTLEEFEELEEKRNKGFLTSLGTVASGGIAALPMALGSAIFTAVKAGDKKKELNEQLADEAYRMLSPEAQQIIRSTGDMSSKFNTEAEIAKTYSDAIDAGASQSLAAALATTSSRAFAEIPTDADLETYEKQTADIFRDVTGKALESGSVQSSMLSEQDFGLFDSEEERAAFYGDPLSQAKTLDEVIAQTRTATQAPSPTATPTPAPAPTTLPKSAPEGSKPRPEGGYEAPDGRTYNDEGNRDWTGKAPTIQDTKDWLSGKTNAGGQQRDSDNPDTGNGTYCCTKMVDLGIWSKTREVARMHKWHLDQPQWWRDGYDVWGKVVADNLLTKKGFCTDVMQAFYDKRIKKKPGSLKSFIADVIIFPGAYVCGHIWKHIPTSASPADPKELS